MKLLNPFFRMFPFLIMILCLFSAIFFFNPSANAEDPSMYNFMIGDEQKEILFSPELELERLNSLIEKEDDNADYHYNRGWLFERMDENDRAEEDYSRAIELDKGHADALYNRGLIYLKTGRYELAIKDFTEVIILKPDSADAFCNRGNAYLAQGNDVEALKDFNSAIKIDPQDPDLYYNRAVLYLSMGMKKEAIKDMLVAARLGNDMARDYLDASGDRL